MKPILYRSIPKTIKKNNSFELKVEEDNDLKHYFEDIQF